jgi:hypothetical protein
MFSKLTPVGDYFHTTFQNAQGETEHLVLTAHELARARERAMKHPLALPRLSAFSSFSRMLLRLRRRIFSRSARQTA